MAVDVFVMADLAAQSRNAAVATEKYWIDWEAHKAGLILNLEIKSKN